jgi:hypothetical protein
VEAGDVDVEGGEVVEAAGTEGELALTDLVLGHPGIYSNLLELQPTIMCYTTL